MSKTETTTWYRAVNNGVEPVPVLKETISTLVLAPEPGVPCSGYVRRVSKHSEYASYFRTETEAWLFIAHKLRDKIDTAKRQIEQWEQPLAHALRSVSTLAGETS